MNILIAIVFYIIEILLIVLLVSKIKRYKSLSIKDTLAYPLLLVVTFLLLLFTRLIYVSTDFWDMSKASFNDAFDIIKLSLNKELVEILKVKDIPLLIAYYGTYAVSLTALSSLTIYLVYIAIKNLNRLLGVVFKNKNILLILGFNDEAKKMIKNFKGRKVKMIAVLDSGSLNKFVEEKTYLDRYKISYVEYPYKLKADYLNTITRLTRYKSKNYTLLTFFEEDKKNDEFSTKIIEYLNDNKRNKGNVKFVMCVNETQGKFINEKIYSGDKGKDISRGKLRTYNKYDLNSYLFMKEHNFAKYIRLVETEDMKFINDDGTLINADINAFFIGYGKINQKLLRDVIISNQFVEKNKTDEGYILSPYHIKVDAFDDNLKINDLSLYNGLLKYNKNEFKASDHLDLPEDYIDDIKIHKSVNIEDEKILNKIYDDIKSRAHKNNKKQINFFFISLKSDMYNTLIGKTFKKHLDAIDEAYNFYFVRKEITTSSDIEENNFKYIGKDKDLYSYENVLLNDVYEAAKIEHYKYLGKYDENIEEKWLELPQIKQISNIYSVLSLNFKNDLLGLNKNNYKERYNPNNLKPVSDEDIDRLIKPHDKFDTYDVLAVIEHQRWVAFELAQGLLPMKLSMFEKLNENTKEGEEGKKDDEKQNYHLCITSQKGLVEYYNLFKKHKFNGANVIAYDYSSMDNFINNYEVYKTSKDN